MSLLRYVRVSYFGPALYRVRQKSSPLKFFAVFSATAWNVNMEFYRFIYRNVLHLTAKSNIILLKNDEIIDIWTWPPADFLALKMFKLKMLFNFQTPVTTLLPMTSQWRFDKQ